MQHFTRSLILLLFLMFSFLSMGSTSTCESENDDSTTKNGDIVSVRSVQASLSRYSPSTPSGQTLTVSPNQNVLAFNIFNVQSLNTGHIDEKNLYTMWFKHNVSGLVLDAKLYILQDDVTYTQVSASEPWKIECTAKALYVGKGVLSDTSTPINFELGWSTALLLEPRDSLTFIVLADTTLITTTTDLEVTLVSGDVAPVGETTPVNIQGDITVDGLVRGNTLKFP